MPFQQFNSLISPIEYLGTKLSAGFASQAIISSLASASGKMSSHFIISLQLPQTASQRAGSRPQPADPRLLGT